MRFKDFPAQEQSVQLLQRSLERGRVAHGYLFFGESLEKLEQVAATLARTLNCHNPVRGASGAAIDCCDACPSCLKISHLNHGDVHWVRPESKSRVIVIEQVRDLMQVMHLKPTEAEYKVAVIAGADRLNVQAANAFLKTLEEPPLKSILILLTTEPQRLLETILSRCLRLGFGGSQSLNARPEDLEWLRQFSDAAGAPHKSLLSRYRLLDVLLQRLQQIREKVQESLQARSPLNQHPEAERDLREQWEGELTAAVESEYRRERGDLLLLLQWWFRDVWLHTTGVSRTEDLTALPAFKGTQELAGRITSEQALDNLRQLEQTQRLLYSNVQEALALEVGLLKLNL